MIFPLARQGEDGENVGVGLLTPEDAIGGIGLAAQGVIRCGIGSAIFRVEHLAGHLSYRAPALI